MHITTTNPTMSSREIAELVESRHDSVKRAIERLADSGVIVQPPMVDEQIADKLGRPRSESVYLVNKRDSYVVVAQLCPEFTARLVDRWQELEDGLAPKTYAETLRALADTVEREERLQAEKASLEVTLDMSMQWASVKKMEATHGVSFYWKPLKDFSLNNGYEVKSVFDANYTKVNAYHIDAWQAVYGVGIASNNTLVRT